MYKTLDMIEKEETISEYQKSQTVRLCDILILAPFLIYAGAIKSTLPNIVRTGLVITGIATLLYNGKNYLKNISE